MSKSVGICVYVMYVCMERKRERERERERYLSCHGAKCSYVSLMC